MATAQIASLNDKFRTTLTGGQVVITHGVQALGSSAIANIIEKVRGFNLFTEDNDPYGEHDFGSVIHEGQVIFWKMDDYDQNMEFGSHDPTDPSVTTRVLTIMLDTEY